MIGPRFKIQEDDDDDDGDDNDYGNDNDDEYYDKVQQHNFNLIVIKNIP